MNLTATIGAAAVLTALAAALFAVGASVIASQRGRPELLLAARRAMPVAAAFTTLAIATLAYALLNDDFSLSHVASVSSSDMLPHMKWASLYSGQPGSLLFWTWLLSLFLAAFTLLTVPRIPWGSAQAVAIGGGILAAFLVPVAFLASPVRGQRRHARGRRRSQPAARRPLDADSPAVHARRARQHRGSRSPSGRRRWSPGASTGAGCAACGTGHCSPG